MPVTNASYHAEFSFLDERSQALLFFNVVVTPNNIHSSADVLRTALEESVVPEDSSNGSYFDIGDSGACYY